MYLLDNKTMIVSFFGHARFPYSQELPSKIMNVLEEVVGNNDVEFFVGFYGAFENICFECAVEYKSKRSNVVVTYVTPYIDVSRYEHSLKKCDGSIYPEIERTPQKFAIIKRNEWVINHSDVIIFYNIGVGKTNDFYEYAQRRNKKIINLADL